MDIFNWIKKQGKWISSIHSNVISSLDVKLKRIDLYTYEIIVFIEKKEITKIFTVSNNEITHNFNYKGNKYKLKCNDEKIIIYNNKNMIYSVNLKDIEE